MMAPLLGHQPELGLKAAKPIGSLSTQLSRMELWVSKHCEMTFTIFLERQLVQHDQEFHITDALQMDSCRWVTSGTLVIYPQNLDARTIDFGNGDCNEGATLQVNGNTYNFTMW
jgi:hypothetical protein